VIHSSESTEGDERIKQGVLGQLSEGERSTLLEYAIEQRCAAGDLLVRAGDPGDRIWLILEGVVLIESEAAAGKRSFNEERGPGELVGMLAFFTGDNNHRAVRCTKDSRFAVLPRQSYDALLSNNPLLWRRLQEIGLQCMREFQLSVHLDSLFGPFGIMLPHVLKDLEDETEWISLRSGETLYRQGDQPDGAYVLMAGRLQMATETGGGEEVISNTVIAGETVGEVAVLTGKPQAHTVYAARDSELAHLSNYGFTVMLQRNTKAIYNVSRILGERLANGPVERDPSRSPIRCISLIQASPEVDLAQFARELETEIGVFGSTLHLTSGAVESALAAPGISRAGENEAMGLRLTQWLHSQESAWRYLIYRGDPDWNDWSARCVRQSDEVVVVADGASEPCLQQLESRLSGPRQRWRLVLLHPADLERPRNTAHWLQGSSPQSVFHVRRGHRGDLSRLARILTGNAVSLVLGGGGARGFAHIGVCRALEELGVPVDMVGGTSMGAPIAGILAQGSNSDELNIRCREAYHNIIDLTLPLVSLLAGARISATIGKQTGDWDIEDYWLPFFCVSASLTTAQPVIHRRGNSWRAIRSSVSIPGVLPPVAQDREYLVDGGLLNNLPVDIMREMNPFGTVIAVDVTPPRGPVPGSDYGTGLSGWHLLLGRLLPWRKTQSAPSIATTMLQSMVAGSALKRQQILEQGLADVYLNINVKGVGMLQFDAQDRAAQLGYDSAIGPLRAWADRSKGQ